MSDEPVVRFAVVGFGKVARTRFVPAAERVPSVALSAIATRQPGHLDPVALGLASTPRIISYHELLRLGREIADAVYIALPNDMHSEWVVACAEAGLHILCEKPLAYEARMARNCRHVCEKQNRLLAEGFTYRHAPCHQRARQSIASGAVGRPHLIEATFTYPLEDLSNIRLRAEHGGGALTDIGCYGIDLARFLLEEEPIAAAARGTFGDKSQVDEVAGLLLSFASGAVATITASTRIARYNAYRVPGDEGSMTAPSPLFPAETAARELWLERPGQSPYIEYFPPASTFEEEIRLFAEAVREGRPALPFPFEDGLANATVLDAARRSLFVGDDHALDLLRGL